MEIKIARKTAGILLTVILVFFTNCKKDYCITITNVQGENCCVKCFRNNEKSIEYLESLIGTNYTCADICD